MTDLIFEILNYIDFLINNNFIVSLIIFFLFATFIFLFSIPGNVLIIISSSYFFGMYIGFFISIISLILGSLIFFYFIKTFIKRYQSKLISKYSYKLDKIIKKSSYEYLILLRLTLGIPLLIQNLFLTTLDISKSKFIISTFIGFTPYFLFFSFVGSQFSNLINIKEIKLINFFSFELFLIFIIIIIFLLSRIVFKLYK